MTKGTARFALQGLAPAKPHRSRIGFRQEQIMMLLPARFMELADALGTEGGNISRMIASLEKRGLVVRVKDGGSQLIMPRNQ